MQVRPICSSIARSLNLSYGTMSKIAKLIDVTHKVEGDRYKDSVDAMLVDAFGGGDFIRWASSEIPEDFRD